MTVRAGAKAKDRQGQPDPGHFERFCREIVPGLLTDVCHVDQELAAQVGKDIRARAESYDGAPGMAEQCGSLPHPAASHGTSASFCGLWSTCSPMTCLS